MIAVNLRRSYPDVQNGSRTLEDVTLGNWAGVSDEAAARFGDVVIGVYGDEVVSAYDTTGWARVEEGRVRFDGVESVEFEKLIGQKPPVAPWTRGQARPVKYVDTDVVRTGEAAVEILEDGVRRAVVGDYTVTLDGDGGLTVEAPAGSAVHVVTAVR
ncbi:hypothetical protein GCM10022286_00820 [Gryllotalpicola daejeonensis]|uniref:Uncharacterized protein n=1 Tax=Gryllotalpicola daejeonensis TaxID=993087 RepID=A0ABP7ZD47_9MICO